MAISLFLIVATRAYYSHLCRIFHSHHCFFLVCRVPHLLLPEIIYAGNNRFTGTIPTTLHVLSQLGKLVFRSFWTVKRVCFCITASLLVCDATTLCMPLFFGNAHIEEVVLVGTDIVGTIPTEIGLISTLGKSLVCVLHFE